MRHRLLSVLAGLLLLGAVSREARAATGINDVLGAISNTYGTFQAAQFVLGLFGVGTSPTMAAAVSELETFMRNYRDQALVNSVNADLNLFTFISSNYQSGLTNDLEANFIAQCINDLSQLQGDIQNGTMADAYALTPAFNLLTATFVGAVKAFGIIDPANAYPDSVLNQYLDSAANLDYTLVGGGVVFYDLSCPACDAGGYSRLFGTQGEEDVAQVRTQCWGRLQQRFSNVLLRLQRAVERGL